ncbi:hypothetical protein SK128_025675, partial [Halocaridina rubra]
ESRLSLHGVLSWKSASVSWAWVKSSMLAAMLPLNGMDVVPGSTWRLFNEDYSQEVLLR